MKALLLTASLASTSAIVAPAFADPITYDKTVVFGNSAVNAAAAGTQTVRGRPRLTPTLCSLVSAILLTRSPWVIKPLTQI